MRKIIWLTLLFTILSCETEPDKLMVSKFKITDANGQSIIRVDEKGNVIKQGIKVGAVKKKGVIVDKKERTILQLGDHNDSLFLDNEGKEVLVIHKDGKFLASSGEQIHWSDAGELMKDDESMGITVSPVEKSLLQIASVLLYLHYVI
ncbi:hypothetical protein [Flavobacterium sp. J27]|uniref:hypothetical protein n=1 Tax=Flavobacterium sp. J27 TaxID=2060419 RepID=UPI001031D958|nr:hypothetical protein [Flavobacterium sp. J27]